MAVPLIHLRVELEELVADLQDRVAVRKELLRHKALLLWLVDSDLVLTLFL